MPFSIHRVRHGPQFRMAAVVSKSFLTPKMIRVIFHAPDFEGFSAPGFDDHVRLFFPKPGEMLPTPTLGGKGTIWPNERPVGRDYTPRVFESETNRLTIDFVVHAGGLASNWALNVQPGDRLGIGGPRGSFVMNGTADWNILAGDETALPAIGRRLEELPATAHGIAFIEIADIGEIQPLRIAADVEIVWLARAEGKSLLAALEDYDLPDKDIFMFVATEASQVAKIRPLMARRGLPEGNLKASNYWRLGRKD